MTLETIDSVEFEESTRSIGMNSADVDNKSGSGGGFSQEKDASTQQSNSVLTKKERNMVMMSRIIVLSVLMIVGVTACVLTWIQTTKWETQDFESQFESMANELNDTTKLIAENGLYASLAFSTAITTFVTLTQQTWPNTTIGSFEAQCVGYRGATGAESVFLAPFVSDVEAWNQYSTDNQGWVQESHLAAGDTRIVDPIAPQLFRRQDGANIPETNPDGSQQFLPIWQACPAPADPRVVNFNLLSVPQISAAVSVMLKTKGPVLTAVVDLSQELGIEEEEEEESPMSILLFPVFAQNNIVGATVAFMSWVELFSNSLHEGSDVILMVLRNSCGEVHSFSIGGTVTTYMGPGDSYIEPDYAEFERVVLFGSTQINERSCIVTLHLFPTEEMAANYETDRPDVYTGVVAGVFLFAAIVFIAYDCLLDVRLKKLSKAATKSATLVATLFPEGVRNRLLDEGGSKKDINSRGQLKQYLNADGTTRQSMGAANPNDIHSKPIADLFPNTTVLFADIAGFTAWSSVREPSQVFILLESVYSAFDKSAKHRGVFKVETIGDCYMAVTGLPEPRDDHAVAMGRFARDCMIKMNDLTKKLELTLGPDTADLAMRFGMHSGPVTAGVLRGDKSRFQLFGDTVNTASRIESTGIRNRIHISLETHNQLLSFGKANWVIPREDVVVAKGKGQMKTFWLIPSGFKPEQYKEKISSLSFTSKAMSEVVQEGSSKIPALAEEDARLLRLVDWVVDVMKRLLMQIEAKRKLEKQGLPREDNMIQHAESMILTQESNTLDEVQEIVMLPMVSSVPQSEIKKVAIRLSDEVVEQLNLYVKTIATMYRQNHFHNFEHAAHVTMSVSKLMSRIVAPGIDFSSGTTSLHDHTFGITSDPLTQFAVVFAGLIHDVDHVGVPNFILQEENKRLGKAYKNKSVAEQNSVDLAWALLMEPKFLELRKCIYHDTSELSRFRQLVVNTILATDIFDKELQELRKVRWDKAFSRQSKRRTSGYENTVNRKATIVIEHLIQASDVAHTMQHWHIYQKWNERLFEEMYLAFKSGRTSKNPALNWYEGELGFYDHYIIPLAKKLKDCGVFGVSSDEYLNYAEENRSEWASKGRKVVAMLVAKYADVDGEEQTLVGRRPSSMKTVSNNELIKDLGDSDHTARRPESFNEHGMNGRRASFLRRNSAR
ncbi:unnamed protein product [Cylindrotheca closterium]|uniref:Phosphodiesterase n=1 Tax=Cylindrotheca closterium TaxID=2856 RepID=A0AAD2G6F1_9STRA|nr:unnamed protein product [Cylindrotheca closterium]